MTDKSIKDLVADIIADGKMTQDEKRQLDTFLLSDGELSVDERRELDALLAMIARGELVVER